MAHHSAQRRSAVNPRRCTPEEGGELESEQSELRTFKRGKISVEPKEIACIEQGVLETRVW